MMLHMLMFSLGTELATPLLAPAGSLVQSSGNVEFLGRCHGGIKQA